MNTKTLKALTVAITLAGGVITTTPAMATLTTNIPAGAGIQDLFLLNGVDIWTFTCPAAFPLGRARVQDVPVPVNLPARLQVRVQQWGLTSLTQTDNSVAFPGNGEGGLFSNEAQANGVAFVPYIVMINKTAAGWEQYTGDLYCENAANVRFNPVITRLLSQ